MGELKRILIVDDDEDLRRGLNARLRASGYDTVYAFDAVTALMSAKKQRPDLVVLDLGLPAGDGFKVLERMSALGDVAQIPVIVLSARPAAEAAEQAMELGAKAYFQKPANNEKFMAEIDRCLMQSAA